MKLGVISDTHGNLAAWELAWDLVLHDCSLIFHCGDALYHGPKFKPGEGYEAGALAQALNACPVPLILVRGNADSEVDQLVLDIPAQSPYAFAQVEGIRLLVSRGNLDFVLTGHTHVPAQRRVGSTLHVNPGTTTFPLSPEPALRRRTCAALLDGEPHWLDLDTGEELQVPR